MYDIEELRRKVEEGEGDSKLAEKICCFAVKVDNRDNKGALKYLKQHGQKMIAAVQKYDSVRLQIAKLPGI